MAWDFKSAACLVICRAFECYCLKRCSPGLTWDRKAITDQGKGKLSSVVVVARTIIKKPRSGAVRRASHFSNFKVVGAVDCS